MEYFEIKILYSLLEFIKFKGTAVIFSNYPKILACHIHKSNIY